MRQTNDLESHSKAQLGRIAHLQGFPTEAVAVRDYVAALCAAGTQQAITAMMDDLVGEDWARCPTAASIRTMAYDRAQARQEATKACPVCQGVGAITVWRLVTFRGNSFAVAKVEALPADFEGMRGFAEKLAAAREANPKLPNQMVLTAAKACVCAG